MPDTLRREAIRSRVRAKAESALRLRAHVVNVDLKRRLALVASRIADIETLFLDQLDARTLDAELLWLDAAEKAFRRYLIELRALEDAVAKHGHTLDTI